MSHLFTLGTIDFNSHIADGDGIVWYGRVEGWDAMTNRVEEGGRPAKHGGITLSNLYDARQMTVFGTAVCDNEADYWLAKNKIVNETNALTSFADPQVLLTLKEDIYKQMVIVRTSIQMTCIEERYLQFEMTIRGDDPFHYDITEDTLTTSGVAANDGNTETYPTFTLTSAGAPYLTLNAGRWVSTVSSLPSGTVLDFAKITVLDGVTNYFGNMNPASDWFGLAPGNNTLASTVAGTWAWRSAWL